MPRQTYSKENAELYANIVITYADYIIFEIKKGNRPSVRSVEKHFKELGDPKYIRSHVTIYKLLTEVLPIVDIDRYLIIEELFDKNNDINNSIVDPKVRERVYKVVELFLNGYTIEEIVNAFNNNYEVIYRDLTVRFRKIAIEEKLKDKYTEVINLLKEYRLSGLANYGNNCSMNDASNQQRDENGRFKK